MTHPASPSPIASLTAPLAVWAAATAIRSWSRAGHLIWLICAGPDADTRARRAEHIRRSPLPPNLGGSPAEWSRSVLAIGVRAHAGSADRYACGSRASGHR